MHQSCAAAQRTASAIVGYGNIASANLISPEITSDPGIYPTAMVKAKLFPDLADSEEYSRLMVKYLFKKPGWLPQSLGGYRAAPEVDKLAYKKYDTPAPMSLNLYVLFQYILCLIGTAIFLNKADQFTMGEKIFITSLICIVVVNSGVLFEQRTWAKYSEWIRIILYPLLLAVLTYNNAWSSLLYILAGAYFIVSISWFYAIQRKNVYIQMV